MLDLQNYHIDKKSQGAYIPILDKDPIFAAKFLSKEDLKKGYGLLTACFLELRDDDENCLYPILMNNLLESEESFLWFVAFYKQMEEVLQEEPLDIPYNKIPRNHDTNKVARFQQPFRIMTDAKGGYKTQYLKNISRQKSTYNNYRIQYVLRDYGLEDFQDDCFPAWYLFKDTVIFEQYNERINTRVKITFRNGEFQYYIAGASDNWQEIAEVPLEIDQVVAALLLRNTDFLINN